MDTDLVLLDLEAEDHEEVIRRLGSKMLEKGYVKTTYIDAVLERERNLPTGLNLGSFCVAIPHTNVEHVHTAHFAVGVLKKSVQFRSMINPEEQLEVGLVFLLAIKNPEAQALLLKKLMSVFQNVALLEKIKQADSKEKIGALLASIEC